MNDTLQSLDLTVLETLDFEPACQGEYHPTAEFGHSPEESAAYLQIAPCGFALLKCASNVARLRQYRRIFCDGGCWAVHEERNYQFIPL